MTQTHQLLPCLQYPSYSRGDGMCCRLTRRVAVNWNSVPIFLSPSVSPMSDSVLARPSYYQHFGMDKKIKPQNSEPFLTVPTKSRPAKLVKTVSDSRVATRRTSGVQSCSIFHSLALEHSPVSSLPYPVSPLADSGAVTPITNSLLHSMLAERENEFIWKDQLSIFCTTWNCHGKVSSFIVCMIGMHFIVHYFRYHQNLTSRKNGYTVTNSWLIFTLSAYRRLTRVMKYLFWTSLAIRICGRRPYLLFSRRWGHTNYSRQLAFHPCSWWFLWGRHSPRTSLRRQHIPSPRE